MKYDDIINYSQQKRKNHKEISKWFFGGGGDDDIIFELNKRIKELEGVASKGVSQIFMETPYRNNHLLSDLLANVNSNAMLCIGCKVGSNTGWVKTKTIAKWKIETPDLHKQPCIFILGV
jgi:16S rRNA C1402 (ribose-2'-O) methylase RsmI